MKTACTAAPAARTTPYTLKANLNGFTVEAHEGGFDGSALVPESEEQVLRCRSRREKSISRRKKS